MTGSSPPPSLAGADWLLDVEVQALLRSLAAGGIEARVVGGAVRDALLGRPVREIDVAAAAPPDAVERAASAAGIKVVPTGREHGTLTLVVDGRAFEVTSLRIDVETDGRHAIVRFGTDWAADAARRDFTINALSTDAAGTVYDPVGGYADILARRVRFIGEADQRIAEDRLRALRFFRFHAELGRGDPDRDAVAAAVRARYELTSLSGERVGQEMRKLCMAPGAAPTLEAMQDAGILPLILGGVGYLAQFRRLTEAVVPFFAASFPVRLCALACRIEEDVARLTGRLRLANAERDEALAVIAIERGLPADASERDLRRLLYRFDAASYHGGLQYAWAVRGGDPADWLGRLALPERWPRPTFPLRGKDVVDAGVAGGPAVGEALRKLEAAWVEGDFRADESELRHMLRRIAAPA
ncbi:MAG: CCA tRNA nucleotidyltransferase [Bauldia sp.]